MAEIIDFAFSHAARSLGPAARTRARLMDAAVHLFARRGFEAASESDICRLAGVSGEAFRDCFADRDDVAGAVAMAVAGGVAAQMFTAMSDLDDAVERTCLATRSFVELAASRPDWGRTLFHAVWKYRDLRARIAGFVRSDLERGLAQRAFSTPVDDVVVDLFGMMTVGALFERLEGRGPEAVSRVAELQALMMGADPDRAWTAAWRPLQPLALTLTPPGPEPPENGEEAAPRPSEPARTGSGRTDADQDGRGQAG